VADALEARLRADLGFDPDGDAAGAETRERTASLALVLAIAREATAGRAGVETAPELDARALLADFEARAAAEAAGSADGVNLLTLHRAKGLEWDAVLLPGMEEGTLPIRQAADDEALAEERRLLYVGLTRARRHLALSWAERRAGPGDRESQRRPSRFLPALEAGHPGAGARPGALPRPGPAPGPGAVPRPGARSGSGAVPRPGPAPGPPGVGKPRFTVLPGPVAAPMTKGRPTDEPLMADLRAWRSTRARDDFVPAYVVAHDALLAAIVEQRPGSIAALRRVKGMGPAKLDRYGDEILAILARH
jgi:DNA helicase-2/ATP-dependent DNA helicase PcrA